MVETLGMIGTVAVGDRRVWTAWSRLAFEILRIASSCLQNYAVMILALGHCRSLSKGPYDLS